MNALDVEDLVKDVPVGFLGRPKRLLHGLTFSVAEGTVVGFVGQNGAGKSTTIRHLIGSGRPTSGSVRLFGVDPTMPAARTSLGYLPDQPALPRTLTAREVIALHTVLHGAKAKPDDLLARLGLADAADVRVQAMSKGMQTRLGLAIALIGAPRLLVLDEPMSGLDPLGRRLVRDVVKEQAAQGTTIFFSSHVLSDIEALCSHVVIIDKGRLVFQGTADAFTDDVDFPARIVFAGRPPPELLAQHGRVVDHDELETDHDPLDVAVALRAAGVVVREVRLQRRPLEDRLIDLLKGKQETL